MGLRIKFHDKSRDILIIKENPATKAPNPFRFRGENVLAVSVEEMLSLLSSLSENLTEFNKRAKSTLGEYVGELTLKSFDNTPLKNGK